MAFPAPIVGAHEAGSCVRIQSVTCGEKSNPYQVLGPSLKHLESAVVQKTIDQPLESFMIIQHKKQKYANQQVETPVLHRS